MTVEPKPLGTWRSKALSCPPPLTCLARGASTSPGVASKGLVASRPSRPCRALPQLYTAPLREMARQCWKPADTA